MTTPVILQISVTQRPERGAVDEACAASADDAFTPAARIVRGWLVRAHLEKAEDFAERIHSRLSSDAVSNVIEKRCDTLIFARMPVSREANLVNGTITLGYDSKGYVVGRFVIILSPCRVEDVIDDLASGEKDVGRDVDGHSLFPSNGRFDVFNGEEPDRFGFLDKLGGAPLTLIKNCFDGKLNLMLVVRVTSKEPLEVSWRVELCVDVRDELASLNLQFLNDLLRVVPVAVDRTVGDVTVFRYLGHDAAFSVSVGVEG